MPLWLLAECPIPNQTTPYVWPEWRLICCQKPNLFAQEVGEQLELRIGIHSGPVVAGVIGTKKPFYDVWGDTVNTAARLETYGMNGKIQVTEETKRILEWDFNFEERGTVSIKGKGDMELWYLEGSRLP